MISPITYLSAAVVGGLLITIGVLTMRTHDLESDLSTEKLNRATERAAAFASAASATQELREREHQITTYQAEVTRHAQKESTQRAADVVAGAEPRRRLLDAAAEFVAPRGRQAATDPAAATGSPTATGPGLVLRGVLSGLDDAADDLARYADASRVAGEACERSYGALTEK